MPASTKVLVLYAGGTFGMAPDAATPGLPLRPMNLAQLERLLPKPPKGVNVVLASLQRPLDSASMTPQDWLVIARTIAAGYESHDGFVVIHGTDTLAWTASALSFIFENLAKPVVFTGSMAPLVEPGSDAGDNYRRALQVAGYRACALPLVPEVVVAFGAKLLRGCRTRKIDGEARGAFASPNCPSLGTFGAKTRIFAARLRAAPDADQAFRVNAVLAEHVVDIALYPGLASRRLKAALAGVKGAVLRTYGSGNAPDDAEFLGALGDAVARGAAIVSVSQVLKGMVKMGAYAASLGLDQAGLISGFDITPEAALAKLTVTLGMHGGAAARRELQISQRGEQSRNLFDFNFKIPGKATDKPWSDFVVPDRRFDPTALSTAVLRMKAMKVEVAADADNPVVDLYMNFPAAKQDATEKANHPRRLHRIQLTNSGSFDVVETLPKEKVKNVIGDSDVTLTFVPSKGVSIKFDKLSLSVFTRA